MRTGALMLACLLLVQPHPARSACDRGTFRLAIDIGHYLAAPGATSATGVTEFEYNSALAHDVLAALRHAGFAAAFLIGESGAPLKLEQRTLIAQQNGAALFVSLHHDSVQPGYLSDWVVNGRPQRYSDLFHGYSVFISDRNADPARSWQFAVKLADALGENGLTPSLHHTEVIPGEGRKLLDPRRGIYRFDELAVLRTATMPAVLLESAVIVNRAEERSLRSIYHPKVVRALVEAIRSYCSADTPGTSLPDWPAGKP